MPVKVQPGDTLSSIAARLGVTWQELYALNRDIIRNPSLIYPNTTLTVPGDVQGTPLPSAQSTNTNVITTPEDAARREAERLNPHNRVQEILSFYSDPAQYSRRVGLGFAANVNADVDFVRDNLVRFTADQLGISNVQEGTYRHYADLILRGEMDSNELANVLRARSAHNTRLEQENGTGPDTGGGGGGSDTGGGDLPNQDAPPPEPIRSDLQLQSSRAFINTVLDRYGLGELSDWAWGRVQAFVPDDMILLELREQEAYKNRFPAMQLRQADGLNAVSEEQYIQLENTYHQIMRMAGLPESFYDSREDFTAFIANDLSPTELQFRIDEGYRRVAQTAPEVRAAFAEFYGANGDAALTALYLDPDRAATTLVAQARTAEVAGLGRRAGVGIAQGQAEEIAATSPSAGQILAGVGQVAGQADLERETFSELDTLRTGDLVSAAFSTSGATEARRKIRERRNSRLAAFSGGGGAAFFQGVGFVGTGVADS